MGGHLHGWLELGVCRGENPRRLSRACQGAGSLRACPEHRRRGVPQSSGVSLKCAHQSSMRGGGSRRSNLEAAVSPRHSAAGGPRPSFVAPRNMTRRRRTAEFGNGTLASILRCNAENLAGRTCCPNFHPGNNLNSVSGGSRGDFLLARGLGDVPPAPKPTRAGGWAQDNRPFSGGLLAGGRPLSRVAIDITLG